MTATLTQPADVPEIQPQPAEAAMGASLPTSPAAPAATANLPFNLVGSLRAKMAAEGLSIRKAALIIGIKHPLLWQVMAHRVLPSATMAPLFAAWLGVDVAVLPRSQGRGSVPLRPTAPTPPPAGKPVAASVTARRTRRGRPPASKTQGRAVPTMVNRPLDEVLAAVRVALSPPVPVAPADLHPVMKDQLALAVHTAPAAFRKVIAALLEVSGARIPRRPPGKTGAR